MTIALLQMNSHFDPAVNLAWIDDQLHQAVDAGAAMAFAPEMAGLLDRDAARSDRHVMAEDESPTLAALCDMCARHRIWLHSGSLPLRSEADATLRVNRSHVIDASGTIRARYDKIHLFDVDLPTGESWRESARYARGDSAVVCDTPIGRLGLSICFDVRFPALYQRLVDLGAEVIAVPAAFTVSTGQAHWHVLLRARAIETACHLVASAQVGRHADGRSTYGHGLVVDPWGVILVDMQDRSGMAVVDCDPDARRQAAAAIPLVRNRAVFS